MKRIGLTQRVEEIVEYGERRDCLDQQWTSLLVGMDYCPIPLANRVQIVGLYIATLALDGVMLTGGNDLCETGSEELLAPERDRFEHDLLDVCAELDLPVLGICRGLQLLNSHHGGGVSPLNNHVSRRHLIRYGGDSFVGGADLDEVNSFHGFGISESDLSPHMKAAAWAEDGTIEALSHETLPHFGIMWHPERENPFRERDLSMIRRIFGADST